MKSKLWFASFIICAQITFAQSKNEFLYLATGSCYSGQGLVTPNQFTSPNKIYRVSTQDATSPEYKIADYFDINSQAGDSPISLLLKGSQNIYTLIQNNTNGLRRVESIDRSNGLRQTLFVDPNAFTSPFRHMVFDRQGDLLISRSYAIEKFDGIKFHRILNTNGAYIYGPGGKCASSTMNITRVGTLRNNMIYFLHASQGQNRINFISSTGYKTVSDCAFSIPAPQPSATPTASVYDEENEILIVAYGGSSSVSPDINSIYAYQLHVTPQNVSLIAADKIYDFVDYPQKYSFGLFGVTAMALNPNDSTLYVATAVNTSMTVQNYRVEKLEYRPREIGWNNDVVLTRKGTSSFLNQSSDTKCISDLTIGD